MRLTRSNSIQAGLEPSWSYQCTATAPRTRPWCSTAGFRAVTRALDLFALDLGVLNLNVARISEDNFQPWQKVVEFWNQFGDPPLFFGTTVCLTILQCKIKKKKVLKHFSQKLTKNDIYFQIVTVKTNTVNPGPFLFLIRKNHVQSFPLSDTKPHNFSGKFWPILSSLLKLTLTHPRVSEHFYCGHKGVMINNDKKFGVNTFGEI